MLSYLSNSDQHPLKGNGIDNQHVFAIRAFQIKYDISDISAEQNAHIMVYKEQIYTGQPVRAYDFFSLLGPKT